MEWLSGTKLVGGLLAMLASFYSYDKLNRDKRLTALEASVVSLKADHGKVLSKMEVLKVEVASGNKMTEYKLCAMQTDISAIKRMLESKI